MMPRGRAVVAALLLGASVAVLSGCHANGASGNGRVRLGMVTDVGGLGDRSFNDSAYAGLQRAQRDLHADTQVLQSRSTADYTPNLTTLANKEYDEIFAVGFLMASDTSQVAERYANRHFTIIDAVVREPNVTSVTFREQEGSFLAGVAAAMTSKTKTVAFLGGVDIPLLRKFEGGFVAGVHQIDPTMQVLVKYAGSFDDVAAGKEIAGVLFDQGADIIYVAAGKAGLGAIDQVKPRIGRFIIGVDSNQDALAPGKILTSMVKRVDVGVFRVAQNAVSGKPISGNLELGLRDHAVGLTDFRYTRALVPPQLFPMLARVSRAIERGTIVPPATREEGLRYRRVTLPS